MEIFTLDSSLQPQNLIENYESLIWTERYSTSSDFELKSNDIATILNSMPLESYVSLRESNVPMIVEAHKIEKPSQGPPSVTVTGRSFETVLERRASVKTQFPDQRTAWTIAAAKESDAAYKAMRIVLGDIARDTSDLTLIPPAVSALDAIPEIDLPLPADYEDPLAWSSTTAYTEGMVVTYGTNADGSKIIWRALLPSTNVTPVSGVTWQSLSYEIKPGNLYNTVMELINTNHHGLKAVRPDIGGNQVGIEIYNGADLTDIVVFDARFDQFDDTTYLLSKQGSANVGYVYGSNGSQSVLKTTAPEPSGLERRVLLLDQTSDTTTNTVDIRRSRGLIELYKYNATALFDGEIAIQVAAGYNTQYFLGDILKLTGEYGLSQDVRVAEFIRTSDANGEKAYPAFEAVS